MFALHLEWLVKNREGFCIPEEGNGMSIYGASFPYISLSCSILFLLIAARH